MLWEPQVTQCSWSMEFEVGVGRDEGGVVRTVDLDRRTRGSHGKMSDQKAEEG